MKLRIAIRDLVWLVAVIVLAGGWWIDHHRPPRFQVRDSNPGIIMGKYTELIDNQTGDTWINRDSSWINTSHVPGQETTNSLRYEGYGGGGGGRSHQ